MDKADRPDPRDTNAIQAALRAASEGPYVSEWEFHTIIGLTRSEVRHVLAQCPNTDDPKIQDLAVNNVLLKRIGYPQGQDDTLAQQLPVSPAALRAILDRWQHA